MRWHDHHQRYIPQLKQTYRRHPDTEDIKPFHLPETPLLEAILTFCSDTISILATTALAHHESLGHSKREAWDAILSAYSDDYAKHTSQYQPTREDRHSLGDEITWQRSLKEVEERSFERIGTSGLFKGISATQWEEAGRKAVEDGSVVLRKRFEGFVESIQEIGDARWGVVSVNFSQSFIRGVLGKLGRGIEILANEAGEDGILRSCGNSGGVLATSDQKLEAMKELLGLWGKEGKTKVVYVGDSMTDVECLCLNSSVGIVMTEKEEGGVRETLRRVGVDVEHVDQYHRDDRRGVFWARDFAEISQSILYRD